MVGTEIRGVLQVAVTYEYGAVREVTADGILMADGCFIDFAVCAANFHRLHTTSSGRCVAERDSECGTVIFFTEPEHTVITFSMKRCIFRRHGRYRDFRHFVDTVQSFGWRTYDLT